MRSNDLLTSGEVRVVVVVWCLALRQGTRHKAQGTKKLSSCGIASWTCGEGVSGKGRENGLGYQTGPPFENGRPRKLDRKRIEGGDDRESISSFFLRYLTWLFADAARRDVGVRCGPVISDGLVVHFRDLFSAGECSALYPVIRPSSVLATRVLYHGTANGRIGAW